jgi:hypothetical protein
MTSLCLPTGIIETCDARFQHHATGSLVLGRLTALRHRRCGRSRAASALEFAAPVARQLASFLEALHRIACVISILLHGGPTKIPITARGIPRFSSIRLQ